MTMIPRTTVVWLFLVGVGTTTTHAALNNSDECTLDCPADAPCRFGVNPNRMEHHHALPHDDHWIASSQDNDMHCDCPLGWTGLYCNHKYETCTTTTQSSQSSSSCYHGGQCVDGFLDDYGNEQLFCDCSEAIVDGVAYVGKYCETPYEQICDATKDGEAPLFCVNGADCNPNFHLDGQPCLCADGWEGYHCEFKMGTVPDCDLQCANDGVCVIGLHTPDEIYHHWLDNKDNELSNHMRCVCPPDFGGPLCQSTKEDCGPTGSSCYHGGTCVETHRTVGTVTTVDYQCDCTTASDKDGHFFAGQYCQFPSTFVCSETNDDWFCTNGGSCREDHPSLGCKCLDGFTGHKCEIVVDDDKEQDNVSSNDGMTDPDDDPTSASDDNAEWCGGVYCLNNGKCEQKSITLEDGSVGTEYHCNCQETYDGTHMFAGSSCQYQSTSLCTPLPQDNNDSSSLEGIEFCVHGGTCTTENAVSGGTSCTCPHGWGGRHCEIPDQVHKDVQDPVCGDTVCHHGGTCITSQVLQDDGKSIDMQYCDCSTAFDEDHLYAGTSCQFPSTKLCTHPITDDTDASLEGLLFCTNHGFCRTNPRLGCNCPDGFVGFSCEFENLDENPSTSEDEGDDYYMDDSEVVTEACGNSVCNYGGTCTTFQELDDKTDRLSTGYKCDCSTAHHQGHFYAGPTCQYKSTSICQDASSPSSGDAIFCVNHGVCLDNDNLGQESSCLCPSGWTGAMCEVEVQDDLHSDQGEACGIDNYCYNGGACVTTRIKGQDGREDIERHCDCSQAVNGTDIYAGESCQHKATTLCSLPLQGQSMEGTLFCANGGRCADDPRYGCVCPPQWTGLRCEFETDITDLLDSDSADSSDSLEDDDDYSKCRLVCHNGGTCAKGAKGLGSLGNTVEHVGHLNKTFDDEFFEHCSCPEGFVGLQCQHQVEICPENQHVCLHGSKCVQDNKEYECDCSEADEALGTDGQPLFAGDSCEHPATDICVQDKDYPGRPLYFCVNHGTCNSYVKDDEPDPGCDCEDGWIGPHCEIRVERFPSTTRQPIHENHRVRLLVAIALSVVSAALLATTYYYWSQRRRSSDLDDSQSCMYFRRRRRTPFQVQQDANLAPKRQSALDSPVAFSSSSDPMVAVGLALPRDNEPAPYQDEPMEPYQDEPTEPYRDEPVITMGPPRDEDGHELHSVNII